MNTQDRSAYGDQQYFNPQGPPGGGPRKSGTSTLMILSIIGGIFAVCGALLCGGIFFFVSKVATDSTEMKQVVASDGLSELSVPENWQSIEGADRNAEASLQLGNLFAETYGMVLTEPKSDFDGAVTSAPNPDGSFSLQDYSDLIIPMMMSSGLSSTSKSPVSVGGRPGIRVHLAGDMDGIGLAYIVTLIDGEQHFHQVHVWTLASREARNMPTLLKVADSLKERN